MARATSRSTRTTRSREPSPRSCGPPRRRPRGLTDSGYALGAQLGDQRAKDRIRGRRQLDEKHLHGSCARISRSSASSSTSTQPRLPGHKGGDPKVPTRSSSPRPTRSAAQAAPSEEARSASASPTTASSRRSSPSSASRCCRARSSLPGETDAMTDGWSVKGPRPRRRRGRRVGRRAPSRRRSSTSPTTSPRSLRVGAGDPSASSDADDPTDVDESSRGTGREGRRASRASSADSTMMTAAVQATHGVRPDRSMTAAPTAAPPAMPRCCSR